jgi:CheY-like chemotaxis protein
MNILVVDDHQLYRDTFCELLQSCFGDIQIVAVDDGSRAISLTDRIPFDLLILDYQLRTISGGDVIRRLRARAQTTGYRMPPVILMSSQPDIAVFARSLGAAAFLPKPIGADDLRAAVGPVIERIHALASDRLLHDDKVASRLQLAE